MYERQTRSGNVLRIISYVFSGIFITIGSILAILWMFLKNLLRLPLRMLKYGFGVIIAEVVLSLIGNAIHLKLPYWEIFVVSSLIAMPLAFICSGGLSDVNSPGAFIGGAFLSASLVYPALIGSVVGAYFITRYIPAVAVFMVGRFAYILVFEAALMTLLHFLTMKAFGTYLFGYRNIASKYRERQYRSEQAYQRSSSRQQSDYWQQSFHSRNDKYRYFAGVTDLVQAKERYRTLAKKYHPDNKRTGNTKIMQEITDEFNRLSESFSA